MTDTPQGWEEYWAAWPRKVARLAAIKAYRAALKRSGVTPDLLLKAAKAYAASPERKPEFTCHATTWLNGGRYEEWVYVISDAKAQLAEQRRALWETRVQLYSKSGFWSGFWNRRPWGGDPSDPRPCDVPRDLIEQYRPKEAAREIAHG